MAFTSTNTSALNGAISRLRSVSANFIETLQRRRLYRETVNQLAALSTRELDDLGISRSEIKSVARDSSFSV
jgi:uncharacterized protein YjiS (DUF1127 family)